MKKNIFLILICLPMALCAQDKSKAYSKSDSIALHAEQSNKEFKENYEEGLEYYNKGVDILNNMHSDGRVVQVDQLPDEAKKQFQSALPFFEKAYAINPKNEKLLIALQGVFFSMNDSAKSDRYKNELESLKK